MNYFVSPNALMIEVLINPSGGNTVAQTPFSEQQQLLNRPIVAIEAFCDEDMPFSPLSAGVAVIPVALFGKAFLNIMRSPTPIIGAGNKVIAQTPAGLWYKNIPLTTLRRAQNNYTGLNPSASFTRELFRVIPMFFQWPDSNVAFPTSAAQAAQYSVPFLIHYLLQGQNPEPYFQVK